MYETEKSHRPSQPRRQATGNRRRQGKQGKQGRKRTSAYTHKGSVAGKKVAIRARGADEAEGERLRHSAVQ